MSSDWVADAAFYHIYPLGLVGAPHRNDFNAPPEPRLEQLYPWLDHIQGLGLNAVYFGPIFESTAHGYDTADYFTIDRRLGTNETFRVLAAEMHRRGMRVVLDGVFNHVGRDFWAFRDMQGHGRESRYAGWFAGLNFEGRSPYGDAFSYEGWSGHYDLAKLNLANPEVRGHLFEAIGLWVREFGIDGLRLDAADLLDDDFLRALRAHCKGLRPDFWLMGEIIHGDYRHWANPEMLDSVTNYECYKGLYSSLVDRNYFEIAYSLNRQFGQEGLYRGLTLYDFADNHDVNRVASQLARPAHLYPLHVLLATMPGVPSIYYGSEWGIAGERSQTSDQALRPALDLGRAAKSAPQADLPDAIRRLMAVRRDTPALRHGDYRQLHVAAEQLAFARGSGGQTAIVAVNAAETPATIRLEGLPPADRLVDRLNGESIPTGGRTQIELDVPACWGRILTAA